MKRHIVGACCAGIFVLGSVSTASAAPIYNPGTNNWYEITTVGTWVDAEADAINKGGNLVTINDVVEEEWLRTNFSLDYGFWIGMNDFATEGTWVWSSGESVTYTNWASGEPNNSLSGEDAAIINWSGAKWNDVRESDLRWGVAEWEATVIPVPASLWLFSSGLLWLFGSIKLRKHRNT